MARQTFNSSRSHVLKRGRKKHRLGFEPLEHRSLLATITVTATEENAGEGDMTLYSAIQLANGVREEDIRPELRTHISGTLSTPGHDIIRFAIPGGGQHVFRGELPRITDAVEIDGWSQGGPGYTGDPLIVVDGNPPENPPPQLADFHVLDIRAADVTLPGLVITDTRPTETAARILVYMGQRAHQIQHAGGNRIVGCFIGTNYSGTCAIGAAHKTKPQEY